MFNPVPFSHIVLQVCILKSFIDEFVISLILKLINYIEMFIEILNVFAADYKVFRKSCFWINELGRKLDFTNNEMFIRDWVVIFFEVVYDLNWLSRSQVNLISIYLNFISIFIRDEKGENIDS